MLAVACCGRVPGGCAMESVPPAFGGMNTPAENVQHIGREAWVAIMMGGEGQSVEGRWWEEGMVDGVCEWVGR